MMENNEKLKGMELLRKKIDESGYKLAFIAEKCGLTYQGFLPKLKGERQFVANEIAILTRLLNLTLEEQREIFFTVDVD